MKNQKSIEYSYILGFSMFLYIYCSQGVEELQKHLAEVTLTQQYMGEKIPGVWLNFEELLKE